MARTHYFPSDQVHFTWDEGHEPVITVESGDTVVVHTRDVSDNQITPESTTAASTRLDWDRVYPLAGPIAIEGAEPGDTLAVEVLDLHTRGLGLDRDPARARAARRRLPGCLPAVFDISDGHFARFATPPSIPLDPFLGTMGVCPAGAKAQPVMPPGTFGGNMDTRQLNAGTTLYLPVQVAGALFSTGDAHGCQGDGEVCVTGLEAPMYASLRFTLEKGRTIPAPQYRTAGPRRRASTRRAVRHHRRRAATSTRPRRTPCARWSSTSAAPTGSRPRTPTCSCSLCVDLRISEIVDAGEYIVSALLPEAVFLGG